MVSTAKQRWDVVAARRLGALESIQRASRAAGQGGRWGTDQLNKSLFLVLVAQFQSYCRDLHDESVDVQVAAANPRQAGLVRDLLTQNRQLNHKNPRPATLGSDFRRLGLSIIPDLRLVPGLSMALDDLESLVDFRNAIAHGNESEVTAVIATGRIRPTLASFRRHWRSIELVVATIDDIVAAGLAAGLGIPVPW